MKILTTTSCSRKTGSHRWQSTTNRRQHNISTLSSGLYVSGFLSSLEASACLSLPLCVVTHRPIHPHPFSSLSFSSVVHVLLRHIRYIPRVHARLPRPILSPFLFSRSMCVCNDACILYICWRSLVRLVSLCPQFFLSLPSRRSWFLSIRIVCCLPHAFVRLFFSLSFSDG